MAKGVVSTIAFFLLMACVPAFAGMADHSKFPELQKKFSKPQEVTKACLQCHTEAGKDIMKTSHWTWSRKTKNMPGKRGTIIELGKKNVINNFCIGVASNEPRCTSCHIGYGWKDKKFEFNKEANVDCLVCHEQTGTYKKFPTKAGLPAEKDTMFKGKTLFKAPDYNKVAQSVGTPTRKNCGTCHFYGGGANAVKHGTLDKSLNNGSKALDVHMGVDGANMKCVDCHSAEKHDIKGQLYSVSAEDRDRVNCETCHSEKPHTSKVFIENHEGRAMGDYKTKLEESKAPEATKLHKMLDSHSKKIACQTCHIPIYSKKHYTKTWWDWSTAGKFKKDVNGNFIKKNGKKVGVVKWKMKDGKKQYMTYHFMKGDFEYGKNLVPEYYWFNGNANHLFFGSKFDPKDAPIEINKIEGDYSDPKSKIWPMKVMKGRQIYDSVNNTFVQPKLFGKKGSGAFWKAYNWGKAAELGMKYAGYEYSGKFDFIETRMYWPLAHMVSSKEESLKCIDCHSRNGRLASLPTNWLPGKDRSLVLDILGLLMVLGSLAGVSIHTVLRYLGNKKRGGE